MKADNDNAVDVKVTLARKREVILAVPGRYSATAKIARILDKELQKKKGLFQTLRSSIKRKGFLGNFLGIS